MGKEKYIKIDVVSLSPTFPLSPKGSCVLMSMVLE
jgi:hypothetical protein